MQSGMGRVATGSRVDAIWQSLKAASSVTQAAKAKPSDAASTVPSTSTPNSSQSQDPASASLQDLLLGRVKSQRPAAGSASKRRFAGPMTPSVPLPLPLVLRVQSWIQRPVVPSDDREQPGAAPSDPQPAAGTPNESASTVPGPATQAAGLAQEPSPQQGSALGGEGREGSGQGPAPGEPDTATAASALAAAKAATALVVDDSNKIEVKEVRDFAGQSVEVTRMIDAESKAAKAAKRKAEMQAASSRGLDALLAQLEKKKKLNILDKTRKDWGEYKEGTGVVEELEEYKRSGATYTEKQAFLNRSDVREYEKERDLRMSSRASALPKPM